MPLLDTNQDGHLSPLDALLVINQLNVASTESLVDATPRAALPAFEETAMDPLQPATAAALMADAVFGEGEEERQRDETPVGCSVAATLDTQIAPDVHAHLSQPKDLDQDDWALLIRDLAGSQESADKGGELVDGANGDHWT